MHRRNKLSIIGGTALLIGGLAQSFAMPEPDYGTIMLINAGMILIIAGLIRHVRFEGEVEQDERTKKIAYTSLAAAFQLTLMANMALWWINRAFPLRLTIEQLIGLEFIGMALLSIIMRVYYSRKPNVI